MQAFNLKLHLPPGVVTVPLATKVISQLASSKHRFPNASVFFFYFEIEKIFSFFLRTGDSRIISGNININTSICMWI